ncbi:hypothetical protein AQUCO_00400048v1 [Aquilegia coerulea]|uniref:Uncharacterized protein n=1 Tax=Aquilegia coerulea TaxID=218851 RepID=A0A2G5ET51_AQUCA|nr:hypothetical protein AQUCO_00400048v1 [Aquilegia coerulea]
MATKELPAYGDEYMHDEEEPTKCVGQRRGGWTTFPFITVSALGLSIAAAGWTTNLIVYLIQKFNIKSIHATEISNVVNGCTSFFPIVGAIIADSYVGNFFVILGSSILSLLGLVLLTLTATLDSLRPKDCKEHLETCEASSQFQLAILFSAITLVSIGMGGTRFTLATMGADQFDKRKDQGTFFNWYFFTFYLATIIGITAIVYVEDNVSWGLGYILCLAINAIGLAIFIFGKRYYRHIKPHGSPFTSIARVIVATIRKKKVLLSSESKDYYYGDIKGTFSPAVLGPTSRFRFLNRAAMKVEGDAQQQGKLSESWSLCTVQQVEDFKSLIKISPLWSSSIFLHTPIAIQMGLMVLQALAMDRHIGSHFSIPSSSFLVFTLLATAIALSVFDRFLFPVWKKLTHRSMTPLVRIGIGHILNIIGMACSALVESRRLHVVRTHNLTHQPSSVTPMSALCTATAMISLVIAVAFYLSTALIDLFQRITGWLPDNINEGRIDNVFWMLVIIGVINFGYYSTCAMLYKYNNIVEDSEQKSETAVTDA